MSYLTALSQPPGRQTLRNLRSVRKSRVAEHSTDLSPGTVIFLRIFGSTFFWAPGASGNVVFSLTFFLCSFLCVFGAFCPHVGALGPHKHSKYAVRVIVFKHLTVFASGTIFNRKWPKRSQKEPQNRRLYVFIFRGPLFFGFGAVVKWSKIAPGALQEGHEASKRALGPLLEASGPHFGGSEAYF